jgi:tetratricopeptide (TPR) repeat protein
MTMAKLTIIAAFLRQRLHYPDSDSLSRLGALAGRHIGRTDFLADLEAARNALEPWMPIFVLPTAATVFEVGLHLRPADVRAQRLAFCCAHSPGVFVETALSLEQLVYVGLLGQEGYGADGNMPPDFASSVAEANKMFGVDFYEPGRHGKFTSGDEPWIMVEEFGGTPEAIDTLAVLARKSDEKLALWERGIALGTDSLAMYAGAARILLGLGRRKEAAERIARSLECYHHTAFEVDLEEYFETARKLLGEFPALFSEDTAWQLNTPDPRLWAKRAAQLFEAGQVERADKLLNDLCHGTGDYTAALGAFRKHYQALSWDWALALCELRS